MGLKTFTPSIKGCKDTPPVKCHPVNVEVDGVVHELALHKTGKLFAVYLWRVSDPRSGKGITLIVEETDGYSSRQLLLREALLLAPAQVMEVVERYGAAEFNRALATGEKAKEPERKA